MASLLPPSVRLETSYLEAMAEFDAVGEHDDVRSVTNHESFDAFVGVLHAQAEGRCLPAGWVAGSTLWLVHEDAFIGYVEIRHSLTAALRVRGGHVGYAIRPSMRRRGYGTTALALALPHCLALGIDRVLVTCDETNAPSRRIIEANGGVFEDAVRVEGRAVPTRRYWINRARGSVRPTE